MKTTIEKNKKGFCIDDQKNKYYKKALKKEILSMESSIVPKWSPSIDLHPLVISYINQKLLGIPSSDEMAWVDMCVAKFRRDKLINKPESLEEILEFAVELDMECTSQYKHLLRYLFGIYRKSKIKKPILVQPWANEKIRYELASHLPFHKRIMEYLSRFSSLRKAY